MMLLSESTRLIGRLFSHIITSEIIVLVINRCWLPEFISRLSDPVDTYRKYQCITKGIDMYINPFSATFLYALDPYQCFPLREFHILIKGT